MEKCRLISVICLPPEGLGILVQCTTCTPECGGGVVEVRKSCRRRQLVRWFLNSKWELPGRGGARRSYCSRAEGMARSNVGREERPRGAQGTSATRVAACFHLLRLPSASFLQWALYVCGSLPSPSPFSSITPSSARPPGRIAPSSCPVILSGTGC